MTSEAPLRVYTAIWNCTALLFLLLNTINKITLSFLTIENDHKPEILFTPDHFVCRASIMHPDRISTYTNRNRRVGRTAHPYADRLLPFERLTATFRVYFVVLLVCFLHERRWLLRYKTPLLRSLEHAWMCFEETGPWLKTCLGLSEASLGFIMCSGCMYTFVLTRGTSLTEPIPRDESEQGLDVHWNVLQSLFYIYIYIT